MNIDLYMIPQEITEDKLKDRTVVVIDVLRASTTVCQALASGAEEVIPMDSAAQAIELAASLSSDNVLLCGEREGVIIEGFDLGNSPLEYTKERVSGRRLVFSSTNGTRTMVRFRTAGDLMMAGFVNIQTILDYLPQSMNDLAIMCAGKWLHYAMEDCVCGGLLIDELMERHEAVQLNDGANTARIMYDHFKDGILEMVRGSAHGKYLAAIGMERDLPVCAQLNSIPVLPRFIDGKMRLWNEPS
jgi:2-phosphosulfolactate phosphatase